MKQIITFFILFFFAALSFTAAHAGNYQESEVADDSHIWSSASYGSIVVSGTSGGYILAFRPNDRAVLAKLGKGISALAVGPDASDEIEIWAGLTDGTIVRLEIDGRIKSEFSAHTKPITSMSFVSGLLATVAEDQLVHSWNTAEEQPTLAQTLKLQANAVAISPDDGSILVGLDDNKAELWKSGKLLNTYYTDSAVMSVAFSPSGELIAIGSNLGEFSLFERSSASIVSHYNVGIRITAFDFKMEGQLTIATGICGFTLCAGQVLIWHGGENLVIPVSDEPFNIRDVHWFGDDLVVAGGADLQTLNISALEIETAPQSAKPSISAVLTPKLKEVLSTAKRDQETVRQIQVLLAELGYKPGPADGHAGLKTLKSLREFQKKHGLPLDDLPPSPANLGTGEQSIASDIRKNGIGTRFVVAGVKTQPGPPSSLTIKSAGENIWSLEMEMPSDRIPQGGFNQIIFGNGSIHRFDGTVTFDNAKLPSFHGEGDKGDRLTFVLLKDIGYVYARGRGRVVFPDGRSVKLGY